MNLHISEVEKAIFRQVAQIEERKRAGDQSLAYTNLKGFIGSKVPLTWWT
jgi:hypothetical protein